MNLLSLNNRSLTIEETNGYLKALIDVNDYLKLITQYKPEKRYVDAIELLGSFADTGAAITIIGRQIEADIILNSIS